MNKLQQSNNFTLIRLVLALLVLFGHFKILPGERAVGLFGYAHVAVYLFFIVSGYLVSLSIDQRKHTLEFYVRRLFRLYPLYVVTIMVQAGLIILLLPNPIASYADSIVRYLGSNLIFANFMQYDIGGLFAGLPTTGVNPSLWTLKIEVGFYLIFPLLWWLSQRFGVWVLYVLFVVSTALYAYTSTHNMAELSRQLPCQLRFFIVGMLLYYYRHVLVMSPLKTLVISALMVGLCAFESLPVLHELYPVALGILLFMAAFNLPIIPIKLDISYGVYLFHAPIIQFSVLLGWYSDSLSFLAMVIVVTLILAVIAERLIERPGIALGSAIIRRSRGVAR